MLLRGPNFAGVLKSARLNELNSCEIRFMMRKKIPQATVIFDSMLRIVWAK